MRSLHAHVLHRGSLVRSNNEPKSKRPGGMQQTNSSCHNVPNSHIDESSRVRPLKRQPQITHPDKLLHPSLESAEHWYTMTITLNIS